MTAATVVSIKSATRKTYTVTLEGAESRAWPYSSRTYRPTKLEVVKQDGNVSSVSLSGPHVKKDGTDGTQWCSERFHGDRPEWVTSIIGGLA